MTKRLAPRDDSTHNKEEREVKVAEMMRRAERVQRQDANAQREVVQRLERLAAELRDASDEAADVAEIVREDLADALTGSRVDGAAKKVDGAGAHHEE